MSRIATSKKVSAVSPRRPFGPLSLNKHIFQRAQDSFTLSNPSSSLSTLPLSICFAMSVSLSLPTRSTSVCNCIYLSVSTICICISVCASCSSLCVLPVTNTKSSKIENQIDRIIAYKVPSPTQAPQPHETPQCQSSIS